MKITKIEQQKKNIQRYSLYLDGEFFCGLYEDVIVKHQLKIGQELTQEKIDEMKIDDEYQIAWQKSLRSISRSKKSEKEMRTKLKDFSPEIVDKIIERLIEYRLLNDEDYARSYIRDSIAIRKQSTRMIYQKLRLKGIAKDIIDMSLQEVEQDDIQRNIIELIDKKEKAGKTNDQIMRFLAGRGYSWSTISSALEKRKEL